MNIALWVVQVLLALLFLGAGSFKAFTPIAELAATPNMGWTGELPLIARLAGYSEVLGAIGLILPAATRIQPWLTPLAARCLALVMGLAAVFHVTRGEFGGIAFPLVLGALCLFVAHGRTKLSPIPARGGDASPVSA